MSYIVYAWLTSLTYGVGSIVGKLASKQQIQNPWVFNIVWALVTAMCITPFAVAHGVTFPQHWPSMLLLGIAGAFSASTFALAFYAVEVSVLSPLSNLRTPFLSFIGILFFHESLTSFQWLLIVFIFLAGVGVSMDEQLSVRKIWNKQTALALL